jgi:hypothetical protein
LGKTVGTDGDDNLVVRFWLGAGSDFDSVTNTLGNQFGDVDLAQVKLEEGSVATDFVARPIQQELALCQRYYQDSGSPIHVTFTIDTSTGGQNYVSGHLFPVPMRGAPYTTVAAVYETGAAFNGITTGDVTIDVVSEAGFRWMANALSTRTLPSSLGIQYTADAEL